MWSFLSDLARRPGTTYTVVVLEEDSVEQARQHRVQPRKLAYAWAATLAAAMTLVVLVMAFTPVRQWIPGYGTDALRRNAQLNAMRVSALQDSVAMQARYIERMQELITGRVAPEETPAPSQQEPSASLPSAAEPSETPEADPASDDWADHRQPAVTVSSFGAGGASASARAGSPLPPLPLPMAAPVDNGFPTRGFDARAGHYAVDIAVAEGSYVHAVGDGYVILADWTQDGGYTIAVQHADGYVSVYKHNKRLLHRVGDRVNGREAIAISGNSGEISTGPHLHFELWHHGLAQDPRPYIAGW